MFSRQKAILTEMKKTVMFLRVSSLVIVVIRFLIMIELLITRKVFI